MSSRSWVESANDPKTDFPLANLPFGVFAVDGERRCGVAIGDQIADLKGCVALGLLETLDASTRNACASSDLTLLMSGGRLAARSVRNALAALLGADAPGRSVPLIAQNAAAMGLPCSIGDYTDFYASIHHATNIGSMFRPDNPLLPNYKYVPIGYHGRASSIQPSGTPFRRPLGQTRDEGDPAPRFGPTRRLDYELEVGMFVGRGNDQGSPIPVDEAEEHLFGLCLVNDWSARDIQAWEYQPLGPFLAKSFATTISPWIVTLDALEPFRVRPFERPEGDPAPLPHLTWPGDRGVSIDLEVWLRTERMREPVLLSSVNSSQLYWTMAQLVSHHTSNGCNLRSGDLMASGTVSGPTRTSRGSLMELAWRGSEPVELPGGEQRRFLEDGDEVILRGHCSAPDLRIGFGECRGVILPASQQQ